MSYDPLFEKVVLLQNVADAETDSTLYNDLSPNPATIDAPNGALSVPSNYVLFDGVNDLWRITLANAGPGTGDFCMEFVFRLNTQASTQIFLTNEGLGDTNTFRWQFNSANSHFEILVDGVVKHFFAPDPLTIYTHTWTRSGNTFRFFVDGTKQGSDVTMTPTFEGPYFRIGSNSAESGNFYSGRYFASRVTHGAARYTADHTPESTPYPTLLANVAGTIKDESDTPCSRMWRAQRRSTGAAVANGTTGGDGLYSFDVKTSEEHHLIVLDDGVNGDVDVRNDRIIRILPLGP
jgi:hypothetical protein